MDTISLIFLSYYLINVLELSFPIVGVINFVAVIVWMTKQSPNSNVKTFFLTKRAAASARELVNSSARLKLGLAGYLFQICELHSLIANGSGAREKKTVDVLRPAM